MLLPNFTSCKNLTREQLALFKDLLNFDILKNGIQLKKKMIKNIIWPQFIYFLPNNFFAEVLSEKQHFPKINEIIRPIQKRLRKSTPLLNIYFSVILNKYFSDGLVSFVKSPSVNNCSKYASTELFLSSSKL